MKIAWTCIGACLLAVSTGAAAQPTFESDARLVVQTSTVDLGVWPAQFGQNSFEQEGARRPSPTGALLRSLAVPGWGQVYNRQYLKAPVVVGGMALLVGVVVYSNDRAGLFRQAALFLDCTADPPQAPPEFCDNPDRYAGAFSRADDLTAGPLTAPAARSLRDQFRRQRDLFILFSALGYGLQALDAYVAAELADFDLGEDLALTVGTSAAGPILGLRVRL